MLRWANSLHSRATAAEEEKKDSSMAATTAAHRRLEDEEDEPDSSSNSTTSSPVAREPVSNHKTTTATSTSSTTTTATLPVAEQENAVQQHENNVSSNSKSSVATTSKAKEKKNASATGSSNSHHAASRGDKRKRSIDDSNTNDQGDGSNNNNGDDDDDNNNNVDDDDDDDIDDVGGGGTDHAEDESVPWQPQNVQSTTEFTHVISEYASKRESGCKKAEYSAVTADDHGNRWRLIVYVNGNGRASNHHLSLFLQVADAEDLPFGWKKAVSYVLTLEHPDGSSFSYAKRNPDKTFKLCPKAIDWGWSQFITSDRIQQEGFVSKDSLTVRASVSVKSSSVTIDEEDSELYLKCAVEEGDADAVQLCLENGASVNCKFKDDLYTPLHTACSSGTTTGSMEVLELLLEKGADGNACNKWKETPLLIAANNGHRLGVAALLKHGADPSLCSEAGWSALTFAAHKGYDDIVSLLLHAGAPVNSRVTEDLSTPLHKACAGSKPGHLASVKLLLTEFADVHALNKWRETPLLTAANHGQAGAVEALLLHGADPCKCTDTGWSPLSIAAYKGHDEVVRLLLEEGAPTEEEDPTLSALLQAATKGLPDTVELLLQHGADHTVTTKKGDTALSILVEQNLIEAAVEMVTTYGASIPRCSRDRKKVQRARLLINLRMKQQEREEKSMSSTDEDGDDGESDSDVDADEGEGGDAKLAQHVANGETPNGTAVNNALVDEKQLKKEKRAKKKGKSAASSRMSAEEAAKAAAEALLQELEQEEADAKKEEAEANKKQAKKREKKERERQKKIKEEQARREREEKEEREREKARKMKEEQDRKAREQKQKEQKEAEKKVMAEREKALVAKRKERERKEQKARDDKPRSNKKNASSPGSPSGGSISSAEQQRQSTHPKKTASVAPAPAAATSGVVLSTAAGPVASNRRWENKAKAAPVLVKARGTERIPGLQRTASSSESPIQISNRSASVVEEQVPSTTLAPRRGDMPWNIEESSTSFLDKSSRRSNPSPITAVAAVASSVTANGANSPRADNGTMEHPGIAVFRREKVAELIQRCTSALPSVEEASIKRVISRWIIRSSHGKDDSLDPFVPSWTDSGLGIAFFQRQFIAESRRTQSVQVSNMDAMQEAGKTVAMLCQEAAKEVAQFSQRVDMQLFCDWTDASIGMAVSGNGDAVAITWANRSQVSLASQSFSSLHDRHSGPNGRLLTAIFVAKVWHDTKKFLALDTTMDARLSPLTQAVLSKELKISAELWSDPFTASIGNVFWGSFEQIDGFFGGQKPFGKDETCGEAVLAQHGGSVSVLLPFDGSVAARYMQRMVDITDSANNGNVPVSFTVIVTKESLHDPTRSPAVGALKLFDSRLGDEKQSYIRRTEVINAGQHTFLSGDGAGGPTVCSSDSLLVVLQSDKGSVKYSVSDANISSIVQSMAITQEEEPRLTAFQPNFIAPSSESPMTPHGYFDNVITTSLGPSTPDPERSDFSTDFVAIGGTTIAQNFSPSAAAEPIARGGGGTRRGRLFDLVDDIEEDNILNDVDIVSGMLTNLDVGLFQGTNVGSDIDIEAISLMGIGSPRLLSRQMPPGRNSTTSRPGASFG